ncbi:MAG: ATP-dependent DNA ligase [Candidatus Nanoarchaeia archaeon]|mgnify:FL=1|jgi:DNA ligase-1|nr:ATP-dependent DNA ligase [Candidatus Nanoarchaeia archaeon]|tara:strand:+ start:4750 stop:6435 length:1686 start_codon:yes stop_codon:yes gene_type:complete
MEYSKLVDIYEALSGTSKLLEKRAIIAGFLKGLDAREVESAVLLLEGRLFPEWDRRKIGIGTQTVIKAISTSSGKSEDSIKADWTKIGDLGLVAERNISSKTQSTLFSGKLTIDQVFTNLRKLSEIEGGGSTGKKIGLIAELLSASNGVGAKYIVRTCLEDLRTGAGFGVLRDSIASAFDVEVSNVQTAYDLTTDISKVAKVAKIKSDRGLLALELSVGNPVKVMLFKKSESIEEGFDVVGKPAAIDYKYDGFRLQIHRSGKEIKLFTRNLENVTSQFPDIVNMIEKDVNSKEFIIDCEVIGYDKKTGNWKPFQDISQRIKRKYEIDEMIKEVPVMIIVFDIINLDGENLISIPFSERRNRLSKVINEDPLAVSLAKEIVTDSVEKGNEFYAKALSDGAEGVMMKKLDSVYKPGSRVGYGIKIKPVMETLDLVVVGSEWGSGKRSKWLSSFILACRDGNEFKEIGKMGTGFKEKDEEGVSFGKMTELLKPLIVSESGREVRVKPGVIIEVKYEEIQKSTNYDSGFALRFPRFVRLREDKGLKDVDDLKRVSKLAKGQRSRG